MALRESPALGSSVIASTVLSQNCTRPQPLTGAATRAWWAVCDGLAAAERLLTKLRHDRTAIAMTLGAPVMLVLVFGYIFGSAISVPGRESHRAFLVPGLFVMIAANIVPSMVSMARDNSRGVVERFRSLPVTRAAVPFGQATATAVYGLLNFVLTGLCGLPVGWRINRGAADAVAALGLLVAFLVAMTWAGMYLGLLVGREERAGRPRRGTCSATRPLPPTGPGRWNIGWSLPWPGPCCCWRCSSR